MQKGVNDMKNALKLEDLNDRMSGQMAAIFSDGTMKIVPILPRPKKEGYRSYAIAKSVIMRSIRSRFHEANISVELADTIDYFASMWSESYEPKLSDEEREYREALEALQDDEQAAMRRERWLFAR